MFNTLKILKTMKIKKLFAIAALLLGSTSAFAQLNYEQDYTYNGLIYQLYYDGATTYEAVVKSVADDATSKAQTTWEIPEKFKALAANSANANCADKEFNVTGIGESAFAGNTKITSITFVKPANIKSIGDAAFKGCTALTGFAIGENVTYIGAEAFSGCSAMTELTFGKKVSFIGAEFIKGTAITTLDLSVLDKTGMLTLGSYSATFTFSTTATKYDTPEAVTAATKVVGDAVGEYAFDSESGKWNEIATATYTDAYNVFESTTLESVIFTSFKTDGTPDNWANVSYNAHPDFTPTNNAFPADAFKNCVKLASIVLPASLEALPNNVFKYNKLTTLDLSYLSALGTVGDIFGGSANAKLTTLKLPTTLGAALTFNGTFANCTGLTSLTIPAGWAPAGTHPVIFPANSLKGSGLTTVTFVPTLTAGAWTGADVIFANNAYAATGAPVTVTFSTSQAYKAVAATAPFGMDYDYSTTVDKPITLNGNYALLCQTNAYRVPIENGVVYSIYVDNDGDGTVYMIPFKIKNASYQVPATTPVLVKAKQKDEDGKLVIKVGAIDASGDAVGTELQRSDDAITMISDLKITHSYGTIVAPAAIPAGQHCNVVAIKDGVFGVGSPAENYLNNKTYWIASKKQYGAAGARIVWLDEDDATAIKTIKTKAGNNGAIYNLAGQKVNASYKGVVIKDGKKYIQK